MKKFSTILFIYILTLVFTSCKKESLQSYLVESQEKEGFITLDIPTSFLQLKSEDVSDDVKQTLQSIRKINLVGLPIKGHESDYKIEKAKIKSILKNSKKYKNLMRISNEGIKLNVYYTGDKDAIDEVIAFGYTNKIGVGVVRILGDNMNPSKIIEMMKNIKLDDNNLFSAFFK